MTRKKKTENTAVSTAASPAQAMAQVAPGLAPHEVLALQRGLSKKGLLEIVEALVGNDFSAEVDFTVRVKGTIKRGSAGERKGTSQALRKVTLAVLVKKMGFQREQALKLLSEAILEAAQLSEDAEKKILEEHPEVEEAFGPAEKFYDSLPKIPTRGTINADVQVERVLRAGE